MKFPATERPEATPADYERRAERLFALLDRFKALRSRLLRAMPALTDDEKQLYKTNSEKLRAQLVKDYAAAHFESTEQKVYERRKCSTALVLGELFEIMDKLS